MASKLSKSALYFALLQNWSIQFRFINLRSCGPYPAWSGLLYSWETQKGKRLFVQIYEPLNRISAVISQTSFRGETIEVASRSVGCFLRLIIRGSKFTMTLWRHSFCDVAYSETLSLNSFRVNFHVIPKEPRAFGGIIPSISNCTWY